MKDSSYKPMSDEDIKRIYGNIKNKRIGKKPSIESRKSMSSSSIKSVDSGAPPAYEMGDLLLGSFMGSSDVKRDEVKKGDDGAAKPIAIPLPSRGEQYKSPKV